VLIWVMMKLPMNIIQDPHHPFGRPFFRSIFSSSGHPRLSGQGQPGTHEIKIASSLLCWYLCSRLNVILWCAGQGPKEHWGMLQAPSLLRRVPSFRTFAKGRSWSRRLAIGVGAVVSVPAAVYITLNTQTHKNGVTFKPGVWFKLRGVFPPLARPWQEPEDLQLVGP
jgi:hypothetical protein